jgi:hypothetical protein
MDLLLIVRDALASSLLTNLMVAIDAKGAGREVAVLLTEEALAAVVGGSFAWPRELSGQQKRLALADRGKAAGLPLLAKGEGRQLDPKALLAQARAAGVALYACPIWTALLGLDGKLPEGLQALDRQRLAALMQDARRVVGSL